MIKFKKKCKQCVKVKQKLYLKGSKCFSSSCVFEKKKEKDLLPKTRFRADNFMKNRLLSTRKIKNLFGITENSLKRYIKNYQDNFLFILENKIDFFLKTITIFNSIYDSRQNILFKRRIYIKRKNIEKVCSRHAVVIKEEDIIIIKHLNKKEYNRIKNIKVKGISLEFSSDQSSVSVSRNIKEFEPQNVEKLFQIDKKLLIRYYNNIM